MKDRLIIWLLSKLQGDYILIDNFCYISVFTVQAGDFYARAPAFSLSIDRVLHTQTRLYGLKYTIK